MRLMLISASTTSKQDIRDAEQEEALRRAARSNRGAVGTGRFNWNGPD
jgi:hypothetical protein